MINKVQLLPCF